ncbi:36788_t:CDS:2 [Gigaspora margarita]|uniref:36788_t:CDS:1 n=1 Tax=Gigaspora margarita TaxID=4874 RepID=A0ABN7UX89_GIGMA|nr:36788_t:CDS:2 [Gigaspora margarita]
MEDLILLELLEKEKALDKARKTPKKVVTELKLQKNSNSASTQKNLKASKIQKINYLRLQRPTKKTLMSPKVKKVIMKLSLNTRKKNWKQMLGFLEDEN